MMAHMTYNIFLMGQKYVSGHAATFIITFNVRVWGGKSMVGGARLSSVIFATSQSSHGESDF